MGRTATYGEYIQRTDGGTANATKAVHRESLYALINIATNTTTVVSAPALLFGVYVTTALSAHTVLVQDRTTASVNVSDATSSTPIEIVTATNHGLVSNQTITFSDMPGDFGINLNGHSYVIAVISAVRFFVLETEGITYAAYTSGGSIVGATTVAIIPASAAAGTMYRFPGLRFETSMVVNPDDAATGGLTVAYRPL